MNGQHTKRILTKKSVDGKVVCENFALTCVWDKSNLSGYRDGEFFPVEVGSATEQTEQRIIVGARTNGEGYFHEGDIAAFIILDKIYLGR